LEHLHVAVDNANRLAGTVLLPHERKHSALALLGCALAWFAGLGAREAVRGDDRGTGCVPDLHSAHTPRTNGKAERLIQASRREWAYAVPFATSA
jgi:hypothetical protein